MYKKGQVNPALFVFAFILTVLNLEAILAANYFRCSKP